MMPLVDGDAQAQPASLAIEPWMRLGREFAQCTRRAITEGEAAGARPLVVLERLGAIELFAV